jgi:hypothetical protein
MPELLYILIILFLLWLWRDSARSRERAVKAARAACAHSGAQFLDDTVMLAAVRLCRKSSGSMALCRLYSFDFSLDGEQRRSGAVSMHAQTIVDLVLDVDGATRIQ